MGRLGTYLISLDVDWVPDFIIHDVASLLLDAGVRSTWFITHDSPAVTELGRHPDLVERGIHPNFLPGSSHGKSEEQVIEHLLGVVPEACSTRSHSVYQHGRLIQRLASHPRIKIDSTLYLPGAENIMPVEMRYGDASLLRVPFFWADDHRMAQGDESWAFDSLSGAAGIKVMAFHPLHIYFNFSSDLQYAALRRQCADIRGLTPEMATRHRREGAGVRSMFLDLIAHLQTRRDSLRIKDLLVYADRARTEAR